LGFRRNPTYSTHVPKPPQSKYSNTRTHQEHDEDNLKIKPQNNEKRGSHLTFLENPVGLGENPYPTRLTSQTSSDKNIRHKDTKGTRPSNRQNQTPKIMKRGSHLTFLENPKFWVRALTLDSRPQTSSDKNIRHKDTRNTTEEQPSKSKPKNNEEARTLLF
jgi:hypothetical protein